MKRINLDKDSCIVVVEPTDSSEHERWPASAGDVWFAVDGQPHGCLASGSREQRLQEIDLLIEALKLARTEIVTEAA
jgi:hypothetical protein